MEIVSKTATILAGCLVASIVSIAAQALPGSRMAAQMTSSEVILVGSFCGHGFHRDPDGDCIPYRYAETKFFGLPYVATPDVSLPYVALPNVSLPYVTPPSVGLPYVAPPDVGLPYANPPTVGLRYIEPPSIGLPYLAPPNASLPYVGPPEYVAPRGCPYRYSYSVHHCVPIPAGG